MANKPWKQLERDFAKYFGVMRNVGSGTMGRADHSPTDCHHPCLFHEAKRRKEYNPIYASLMKVRETARCQGRLGVLLLPGDADDPHPTIVVHESELMQLAEAHFCVKEGGTPLSFVLQCQAEIVNRLRKSFDALTQAEEIMQRYPQYRAAVLGIRRAGSPGFAMAFRPHHLPLIAAARVAGATWVHGGGGDAMWEELGPGAHSLYTGHSEFRELADNVYKQIALFQHRWHPPKKRTKDAA